MRAARPEWLVRVPSGPRSAAGAGVLVDRHHVLTCAHVITRQLGEPARTDDGDPYPGRVVAVEFPFSGAPSVRRTARVVGWRPIADDESGDAAILRLAEPVALRPAPLAFPVHALGHRFSTHGFPGGDIAARHAGGRFAGSSGPTGEWVQLEADSSVGWAIERGFSGAPVFDHEAGAVVGIVVMTDAHRSGHMLPMWALRSWWPRLLARRADDASWAAHWLPRARGSERQTDSGAWYFTGRVAARRRICDWLADPSQPALLVTGGPGSGKSALVAHMLVSADPGWAESVPTDGPRPPVGAFDLAVHIGSLSCEDVVARVANALGLDAAAPQELLAAIRQRRPAGQPPLVMIADSVEEAASVEEARRIALFLRNLAGTGAVRVLAAVRTAPAGTRRAEILGAFGRSIPQLSLESRQFQRNEDVADYVFLRLAAQDGRGHYRDRSPAALRKISWAVARRARFNFLIAQLTALWLTQATTPPVDLADPQWEDTLPETVGEAMEEYLRGCGADPDLVRRVLTALAFARGSGLPLGPAWLTMTNALHAAHTHTSADVETVFHSAANYLIERTNDLADQARYRLYHHALDEHLRDHCTSYTPQRHPQRAIARALTAEVPLAQQGRDWALADAYTRSHLAGHAADARELDALLDDPGFLLHAEPGPLLTALPHAQTDRGRLTAGVYRLSEHQHRQADPVGRCRTLAIDAARLGDRPLRHGLNAMQDRLVGRGHGWRVRFATASTPPTATGFTLTGHTAAVQAVAVGTIDGYPIAVTGSHDRTVRIWDLTENCELGEPFLHAMGVTAVAVGEVDGRPVAVACDKAVRVWDLVDSCELGEPLVGHTDTVSAVAVGELRGRPIAVTGGGDGGVRVWDLIGRHQVGEPLTGHVGQVSGLAVGEVDGRPVAVSCGFDKTVRVWDLSSHRQWGEPLTGHTGWVREVAAAELHGRPIAVTTGDDRTVRLWDLAGRREVGEPFTDRDWYGVVAVAAFGGRPIAVTGSGDYALRFWDPVERRALGEPQAGHTEPVCRGAVALIERGGRPIAVTGSHDGTVRVWDFTASSRIGDPVAGHTRDLSRVAATESDGRPLAITGSHDGTVRLWDLAEDRQIGDPVSLGFDFGIGAMAVARWAGRAIAVAGCPASGAVKTWDLAERRQCGATMSTGHHRGVLTIGVAALDSRPIAITAGRENFMHIWDLGEQRRIGEPLTGHSGWVSAVAVTRLNGRPVAVTGSEDRTVRIWDLGGQRQIGEPLTGHTAQVTAMAVGQVADRPIAVTSGDHDRTVRVWDLAGHREIGRMPTGHASEITAIVLARLRGRPLAVTASRDHTVRVWDLEQWQCLDRIVMPGPIENLAMGGGGILVVGFGFDIATFETAAPVTADGLPNLPGSPPRVAADTPAPAVVHQGPMSPESFDRARREWERARRAWNQASPADGNDSAR